MPSHGGFSRTSHLVEVIEPKDSVRFYINGQPIEPPTPITVHCDRPFYEDSARVVAVTVGDTLYAPCDYTMQLHNPKARNV